MIAAAPHLQLTHEQNRDLEYLLLGDLRQVLEEPDSPQTSQWLLAILDMILVGRPSTRSAVYLPIEGKSDSFSSRLSKSGLFIDKLRRLRDRVAHRTAYANLATEIRAELREVMLDRMSSASCLYDA